MFFKFLSFCHDLSNAAALDNSSKSIANLTQSNLDKLLSINARNVSITNSVFGNQNIEATLSSLSCSGRDTNVGLNSS